MYKRHPYVNAVYYEKKMTQRHLREMKERLDYTAETYPHVDLTPFVFMIQFYQTRIDTINKCLRLFHKYNTPLVFSAKE
jgi:hypothetical protein